MYIFGGNHNGRYLNDLQVGNYLLSHGENLLFTNLTQKTRGWFQLAEEWKTCYTRETKMVTLVGKDKLAYGRDKGGEGRETNMIDVEVH